MVPAAICSRQHQRDDEKVLADPALALGERSEPREHRVHRRVVRIVQPELGDEQNETEGKEREAETRPGPHEGVCCRRVADLGLVGPVLRPGPARSWTSRERRQCRIYQEVAGVSRLVSREAIGRRPSGVEVGRREFLRDIAAQRDDRTGPCVGNADRLQRQVDALQLIAHGTANGSLLVGGELVERPAELHLGDARLGQSGEADQRPGGIVLAEIGPHAVEASVVHQVGLLEAGLAGEDVVGRHQQPTAGADEAFRLRRRPFVGDGGGPDHQCECDHCDREQDPLEHIADRVVGA